MNAYIEPPEKPNCEGEDPVLFDDPFFFGIALSICKDCPVRFWCLNTVDPKRNYYDGVVGGHAWIEGKPVEKYSDIYADPMLDLYLGKPISLREAKKPLDETAIRDFLVGKLAWNRLSRYERIEAARRMKQQGTQPSLAIKLTHLNPTTIQAIWREQN